MVVKYKIFVIEGRAAAGAAAGSFAANGLSAWVSRYDVYGGGSVLYRTRAAAGADPSLATMAVLRAGQVYDLADKRSQALAQYRAVLARPNIFDTHAQAEHGIKRPFRAKEKKKSE